MFIVTVSHLWGTMCFKCIRTSYWIKVLFKYEQAIWGTR